MIVSILSASYLLEKNLGTDRYITNVRIKNEHALICMRSCANDKSTY